MWWLHLFTAKWLLPHWWPENCKKNDLWNFMANRVNVANDHNNVFHTCNAKPKVLNKQLISCKRGREIRRCSPPTPACVHSPAPPSGCRSGSYSRADVWRFSNLCACHGEMCRLTPVIPTVDLNQHRNLHLNPPPSPQVPADSPQTPPPLHSV